MSDKESTKILIIDDEEAIRQSFGDHLEDQGFEILSADNGQKGLELIEQENPGIILVDLRMSGIDGLKVLQKTMDLNIPKIVISGINRLDDVVRALRYGAWDYLIKPINDFSILDHSLEKVMESVRLMKENRAYQKNLEKLVKKRTLELEQANAHLSCINARLRKIVETTKGLSGYVEMNRFSSRILGEFAHHMVATGGSLYFVEKGGLKLMHSLDPGHAPDFIAFPLDQNSIFKKVLNTGKPLLVSNLTECNKIGTSGWNGYQNGSLLVFPIPDTNGNVMGVLSLHSKKEPPFIEQDKEIGAILASYSSETVRAIKAFEAVKESEKQYRTLFEKTNDAIFIVQKGTGQCLDANEAAMKLVGRSLKELKQITCHDLVLEGGDKWLKAVTESEYTVDIGQVSYCRPDKTIRIANLSLVPLDDTKVIAIARDITHDLEIQKQLRQSQKMEAIDTLAGGIAHDFNNILSGILGYTQLTEMNLDDQEKTRKNLAQIVKGAQRAAGLVRQILTFSRQADYKKSPLKIHLIVKEAVNFLSSSIPSTIEIQNEIISTATIMADPTQIHQVVMNLCTNAYHAMRDSGGVLNITLEDIELKPRGPLSNDTRLYGKYVKLEVNDTGNGMDKSTLNRIFDPYYTTKKPDQGTGLGLAVVDGIVKKHKGFIKAASTPGKGSRFQVFWPIIDTKHKKNVQDKNQTAIYRGGIEQIMIVDDEKSVREVTRDILIAQGYHVAVFRDGLSALKSFTASPDFFDIIITDMTMPHMTGDKLSAEILNIRKNMPIILCTGYSDEFTADMANEMGISKYIQKPVSANRLSTLIRQLLDNKKLI